MFHSGTSNFELPCNVCLCFLYLLPSLLEVRPLPPSQEIRDKNRERDWNELLRDMSHLWSAVACVLVTLRSGNEKSIGEGNAQQAN